MKGPSEAKELPCEEAEGSFTPRKMFAIGGEFSLLANFRYCSENFVPAPAFLLQNKNKNKINKINKIK